MRVALGVSGESSWDGGREVGWRVDVGGFGGGGHDDGADDGEWDASGVLLSLLLKLDLYFWSNSLISSSVGSCGSV